MLLKEGKSVANIITNNIKDRSMKSKFLKIFLSIMVLSLALLSNMKVNYAEDNIPDQTIPKELADKLNDSFKKENNNYKYPDYFGGMYIDDDNILVIKVTTEKAKKEIEELLGKEGYRIDLVKFSYKELEEYAENFAMKNNVDGFSVDIRNNNAKIYTDDNDLIQAKNKLETLNLNRNVKIKNVDLNVSKNMKDIPGVTILKVSNEVTNAGIVGGSDIAYNGSRMTVGFSGHYGNRPAIVTAGHASFSVGDTVKYNGRVLGKVIFKNFYNGAFGEFSIIEVTNPYFKISNVIRYKNGEFRRLRAIDKNPVEGLYVSKYGHTTKDAVVQIKDTNYSSKLGQNIIKGRVLCRMVRGDSKGGDSGGPYYHYKNNKYHALGIHNSSLEINGKQHTTFTPVEAYGGIFSTKITD